jgi:predicted lipoprotein with Yx(FWY)xxD motif
MRQLTKVIVPTIAASLLLAACGSSSSSTSTNSSAASAPPAPASSGSTASLVKTASNATLGATILVNAQGMTLYRLSGEQNGKWICTSAACVQVWHPLTGSAGATLTGSLGTVKRPDGTTQVAYKGMPLYTFAQDQKAGDAKGQGIKDVGTWSAITTGAPAKSATPSAPPTTSTSSGGGYGY